MRALFPLVLLLVALASGAVTLDFVDTPVQEVARSLSLAYDVPVMVDAGVDRRVTFHLEGVSLLEGLSALCESNGLELVQKENLLVIQPQKLRGKSDIRLQDSLVSVQVQDKDVLEFLEEFSATTGLNILWKPDVQGRLSGSIRSLPLERAFRSLLEINGCGVEK